jgi:hypothetical protein
MITGTLGGAVTQRVTVARKQRIQLHLKRFTLGAHAHKAIKLALPRALRNLLQRAGKLSLTLSATVRDPAGHARTVKKRVAPRLKRRQ